MPCPNCNTPNPGPGPFCMSCGARLSIVAATADPNPVVQTSGWPPTAQPSSPAPYGPAQPVNPYEPRGAMVGNMSSAGTVGVSIWGPFAGYGTRGRHVAWLISNQGDQAETLLRTVQARFAERKISNAQMIPTILQRKGIVVDSRPYTLVRRALATAGLYIARFGQDLYVSQVTYFKGPISNARVLAVIAMIAFYIIYPIVYASSAGSLDFDVWSGRATGVENMLLTVCCVGPFYLLDILALLLLGGFSIYKFVAEKDFWAALRVPPNEFDTDDMVGLEKAVEQTVRECLDVVGIEQKLMPPATEFSTRKVLF